MKRRTGARVHLDALLSQQGPAAGKFDVRNGFVMPATLSICEWNSLLLWQEKRAKTLKTVRRNPTLGCEVPKGCLQAGRKQRALFEKFADKQSIVAPE